MLDPTTQGGGGAIRYPVPQNAMMNVRKSPMDMNTNRYEKPVQATSRRSDRSSSDGVTMEQCQSAYRQSIKTTVKKANTTFADKPEQTHNQGTAVSIEEAGTDGTTNVQGRSIDDDTMKTTVIKLPTDCAKFTEPTLTRVSPLEAKMAHTVGTRVMQYQSDDQNSLKMTNMQMPMDFLEIPEPTLPRGFLQLAEEARNVKIEIGRPCYTEGVQSQGTGLTRPVFVTVVEYSSPVLKTGTIRAAGVSTAMIPTRSSAGRPKPADQLGLVGPQNHTDQPALPGSDADQVGTVPAGPDIIIDRRKPVDQLGLVGPQNQTDQPALPGSDTDQVGTVPAGPVGPDIIIDRLQPVAEMPDQVEWTGRLIQTDFMNLGPITEPASFGDNPPSSDSGVHSLGEQWENMSTSSIDTESEQNWKPTHGSVTGRRVSNSRVPPNTEEDEDINSPWTDCLLNDESDKNSSIDIQESGGKIQYNDVTRCEKEFNSVTSGSDGINSDIATMADFSDDNETWVEQLPGCPIPGCQCEGRIEFMEWGSEDMTETDDSEYEDPMDRINRLYVEDYYYDLFDEIYTPHTEGPTPEI